MSLADTFDKLATAADIEQMIKDGQEEHLTLDFKTVNNPNLNGTDDKRLFAKCVSGFANSSGGLIVWGVEARKNAAGVDAAITTKAIPSIRLLLSRLNALTGDAVAPIADGVRHKIIEIGNDVGYAITLIPESDSGPHMAMLGEFRYFKRSGDSFYRMEHFDLEDMFGRRRKPALSLIIISGLPVGDVEELRFDMQNEGRAGAKHAGFFARFSNAELINTGPFSNATPLNKAPTISYSDNVGVIHPTGIGRHAGIVKFRRLDANQAVLIDCTWYCENMPARKQKYAVEPVAAPDTPPEAIGAVG